MSMYMAPIPPTLLPSSSESIVNEFEKTFKSLTMNQLKASPSTPLHSAGAAVPQLLQNVAPPSIVSYVAAPPSLSGTNVSSIVWSNIVSRVTVTPLGEPVIHNNWGAIFIFSGGKCLSELLMSPAL